MSKIKVKQIDFQGFVPTLPTDPANIAYVDASISASFGTVAVASDINIPLSSWISGGTDWYYQFSNNDVAADLNFGVVTSLYQSGATLELVVGYEGILSGSTYTVRVTSPFDAVLVVVGRRGTSAISGTTQAQILDWETGVQYFTGDYVRFNNTLYRANSDHMSTTFSSQSGFWTEVSGISDWQTGQYYTEGRFLWNSGLYRVESGHTSGTFSTDVSNGLLAQVSSGSISGDYLPLSGGTMTGDIQFVGTRQLTNGTVSITIDSDYVDISTDGINEGYLQVDRDSAAIGWDSTSEFYATSAGTLITTVSGTNINSFEITNLSKSITNNGTNSIIITDQITQKGIVYSEDYSPNFTPESLVSKRWVDTRVSAYLPLTGGTMTGDIIFNSGSIQEVDWIKFNLTGATTIEPGLLQYSNNGDGGFIQGLKNGVSSAIGEDVFLWVKNQTGSPLLKGRAVRAVGTLGASGIILIDYAIADNSVQSRYTIGILAEDIPDGEDGAVIYIGKIRELDTTGSLFGETWNEGDVLYVSPFTPGYLTKIEPEAPNHKQIAALVVSSDATTGVLQVRVNLGGHLYDLHDVQYTTSAVTTGDILKWNTNRWEASTPLAKKSGFVAASGFTGTPQRKAEVIFGSPFIGDYSITITGGDTRNWSWENQTASGFTINANAAATLTARVFWQCIEIGEE